ncbi:HNH endonuclease signature motif containing protein [Nocardioides sp.]|uniref:HNH endonuclease signature motif containing protein n=1 Tax=Nocardioides sp. TaxID=35761 RepID=UPI0027183E90|nr:HNH endonuclease signature motif containing protein [Nocardioides sp.]MDO9455971.1 DUF222 domain-containing protein [Nocardioides sp.]
MDAATTDRVVVLAAKVAAGVAEVEARAVGHAGTLERPGAAGCRSLKTWLQVTTNVTGRSADRKAKLAAALGAWEPTRAATARGEVHAEQAQAIADTLGHLDDDLSTHDKQHAEAFLLAEAADQDADALAHLGHEIYQRLDPESADAREARALEAQEARARRKTRFSMGNDGDGMTHGRFSIPSLYGDMLRKALTALAAPKHVRAEHGPRSYDWQTPTPERMGQAFCDYIARFPAKLLPKLGGLNATVIAIGDAALLEGQVKSARLDTGTPISHTEWLRLACEAGIVPMWMDADGTCLSVGRLYRLHTTKQRLVLIVERRHCEHPGCHIPGWLCHVHHRTPWSQGGTTDTKTAMLLCPFHHHRAHATGETHPQQEQTGIPAA